MFSFNHVTISVDNLDKTLEFYKKFGLEKYKEYSDENVDIVMLKLGNMILEIFHYQEKEKYQLDVDSLLAGADSKKVKPKYWVNNFDNDK